jgi:uncharacterized membrane protein YgdD (TMEM256/DUF423 family)
MRLWLVLAALLGFVSVALGAFGAHGIADAKAQGWMRTAGEYGLIHVLAALVCGLLARAGAPGASLAAPLFLGGVLVFSGSLAAMALGAPRWLGAVTPIGGLLFLAGWAALAWSLRGGLQA